MIARGVVHRGSGRTHEPVELEAELAGLRATVAEQAAMIERLVPENVELRARLSSNSTNSSKPPSSHHRGFPADATAPTCYGPKLRALVCHLVVRQQIPVARVAELLADTYQIPVSTGTITSKRNDVPAAVR